MCTKKDAGAIALVVSLLFTTLPTVCRAKESPKVPNGPTTGVQPAVRQPVCPEDIVIVRLKDGASRDKFDEALEEVHGKVVQTVSVGKDLTFLYVQVEHGQASKVEEKLSKNKDVSLAERNRLYCPPQLKRASEATTASASASPDAKRAPKKPKKPPKKHKKKKKKKKKSGSSGPTSLLVPTPNDPFYVDQVDAVQEKFTAMRAIDTTFGNVVNYCSLDTGSTVLGSEVGVIAQYNYVDFSTPAWGAVENPPFDIVVGGDAYHGTATLSVATSCTNNGIGIAGIGNDDGQHCNVYVFRIYPQANEVYYGSTTNIVGALSYIANNLTPAVINLEAQTLSTNTINNDPAIRQVAGVLYQKGSMIYVPAGNGQYNEESNPGLEDDSTPQNGMVRVAAVDASGTLTYWSNWGPQLTAAGLGVGVACYSVASGVNPSGPSSAGLFDVNSPGYDDGTSVAAPCVAGACACIYRALPPAKKQSLGFPEADRIMWQTATPYPQSHGPTLLVPNLQAAVQAAAKDN